MSAGTAQETPRRSDRCRPDNKGWPQRCSSGWQGAAGCNERWDTSSAGTAVSGTGAKETFRQVEKQIFADHLSTSEQPVYSFSKLNSFTLAEHDHCSNVKWNKWVPDHSLSCTLAPYTLIVHFVKDKLNEALITQTSVVLIHHYLQHITKFF